MGTPLLVTPTIDEVRHMAASLKPTPLPQSEADKFFYHYDAIGWKVGKNKMTNMKSALQGWRLRWEERTKGQQQQVNGHSHPIRGMSPATQVMKQKEYERVVQRFEEIKRRYLPHQEWSFNDVAEARKLKFRRDELRGELGIMI